MAPIEFFPSQHTLDYKITVVKLGELYYLCYQCQATTNQLNDTKCQKESLRKDSKNTSPFWFKSHFNDHKKKIKMEGTMLQKLRIETTF